ncbi:MAG: hypothetical protein WHT47_07590 [Hydrogenothermaceae bacterium]
MYVFISFLNLYTNNDQHNKQQSSSNSNFPTEEVLGSVVGFALGSAVGYLLCSSVKCLIGGGIAAAAIGLAIGYSLKNK